MVLPGFAGALWRRRMPLGLALVAAVAASVASDHPRATSRGVGFTRVALDTPRSELGYSAPDGAESLHWRAALLAHLVASARVKETIARGAGIASRDLSVIDAELTPPFVAASLPK